MGGRPSGPSPIDLNQESKLNRPLCIFERMGRYFFNIYNDEDVLDDEGIELPDLAAAKAEAIRGARGMIADHILAGRAVTLSHRIEIVDEAKRVLASIPFRELITIND